MDSNDFREMTYKIWRTDNLGDNKLTKEKNFNYVHNIIKETLKKYNYISFAIHESHLKSN